MTPPTDQRSSSIIEMLRPDDRDHEVIADWSDADLAAMWRHQLETPLRKDLRGPLARPVGGPDPRHRGPVGLVDTYRTVLFEPQPSAERLRLVKDFAKAVRHGEIDPEASGGMPPQVATMLYFAAIAAAQTRAAQRITTLSGDELREGLDWALEQRWTDEPTQRVLSACAESLA